MHPWIRGRAGLRLRRRAQHLELVRWRGRGNHRGDAELHDRYGVEGHGVRVRSRRADLLGRGEHAVDGTVGTAALHESGRTADERHTLDQRRGNGRRLDVVVDAEIDAALDGEEEEVDLTAHLAVDAVVLAVGRGVELRGRTDGDDEQPQLSGDRDLPADEQRVDGDQRVEPAGHLDVQPDVGVAPHELDVEADSEGDARSGDVGEGRRRRVDAHAVHHEVAAALEELEHLHRDRVLDGAEIDAPVLERIEVEERLHRHADRDQPGEVVVGEQTDRERIGRDVDGGEQRVVVVDRRLQHPSAQHDEHPRARQLQDEQTLHLEDEAAVDGAERDARSERPCPRLGTPPLRMQRVVARLTLQPIERRRGVGARHVDAHPGRKSVDAEARGAERDRCRQLELQGDEHPEHAVRAFHLQGGRGANTDRRRHR